MLFHMKAGTLPLAIGLLLAIGGGAFAEDFDEVRQRVKVPPNQVLVLNPFDGAQVDHADLEVTIASGYGVLTFLSITMNGKPAIKMANIEAGGMQNIKVPKKHLKAGKNRLRIDSWHQMPGRTQRLEPFTAPEITIQVKPARAK